MTLARAAVVVLLSCFTLAIESQTPTTFVLIPTLYEGPGAYGSNWWRHVGAANYSPSEFRAPGVIFNYHSCGIPEGCTGPRVPPGDVGFLIEPSPATGLLLWASPGVMDQQAFTARFGADPLSVGTEMPIVRENEFRRSSLRFAFVQLHSLVRPVRSTLRIYSPDTFPGAKVSVEIHHWFDFQGLSPADRVITLTTVPSEVGSAEPMHPGFAQLNLQQEFSYQELGGDSFNITVTPLPSDSGVTPRIWAFITSTDNETNDVAVQQPQ